MGKNKFIKYLANWTVSQKDHKWWFLVVLNTKQIIIAEKVETRTHFKKRGALWKAKWVRALMPWIMFKKFNLTEKLLFLAALLSLIYSEILFFNGDKDQAIFIGLWVPSLLCFGIYLHLINKKKNDWFYAIFRRVNNLIVWSCI